MRLRRGAGTPVARDEREAELLCALGEHPGISREDQLAGPVGERRGERDVGADAGGFAGRDDDPAGAQGFLIST
jgi:hypothetical protein